MAPLLSALWQMQLFPAHARQLGRRVIAGVFALPRRYFADPLCLVFKLHTEGLLRTQ